MKIHSPDAPDFSKSWAMCAEAEDILRNKWIRPGYGLDMDNWEITIGGPYVHFMDAKTALVKEADNALDRAMASIGPLTEAYGNLTKALYCCNPYEPKPFEALGFDEQKPIIAFSLEV